MLQFSARLLIEVRFNILISIGIKALLNFLLKIEYQCKCLVRSCVSYVGIGKIAYFCLKEGKRLTPHPYFRKSFHWASI